ncbi:MAG: hypothetical protein M3Y45_08460 [Actinomycetota bacterium]|nr:hypothetical protein [Actinomycetota bacterium]
MHRLTSRLAMVVALLSVYAQANLESAAQTMPGTSAVCVLGPGHSLPRLETWTAERIAQEEARTGVRVVPAHPETGTCFDPAGLFWTGESGWGDYVNAAAGDRWFYRYVCTREANGW